MSALITGATAGIGREFAVQLAAAGQDVVLVARDGARLEDLANHLQATHGVQADWLAADLNTEEGMAAVCDRLASTEHPVDTLVNNAGFGVSSSFIDSELDDQLAMQKVMCQAVLVLTHTAAKAMADRGQGLIINVSSVAGWTAIGTYAACKAWTTTFSEALHGELSPLGVHVMALCPGYVRTEFHDRAELDVSAMPDVVWLTPQALVRDCLRDARRRRVVSVPDARYKALSGIIQYAPRPLVRLLSGRVRDSRDPAAPSHPAAARHE